MSNEAKLTKIIPESCKGSRLDSSLAQLFPEYSRARLQKWIKNGNVSVDGKLLRSKDVLVGGEQVILVAELSDEVELEPEDISLDIIFEDNSILVINKPAGLIVHPGAGNPTGTLANGLLYHCPEIRSVPRVGIVHRLDKDTTGLLVIAKDLKSHANIVQQLQERVMSRKYIALVKGEIISGGEVNAPVGRHPIDRKRMAVIDAGKYALTRYRIRKRFKGCTLLDVSLETGRTHQIRVHMSHINFPIVGDSVYSKKIKIENKTNSKKLASFNRQALHAACLELTHPQTGENCKWSAPLPQDFKTLLNLLE